MFNDCNLKELKSYLSSGGGKCLFNLPNTRAMYGGQRCGNGYLEDGEECDCGEEEVCVCCVSPVVRCIYLSIYIYISVSDRARLSAPCFM